MTVAPLTATVLADADENDAGIASGVNNAVARVAGLLAVAALGAVIAARFGAVLDDRLAEGPPLSARAQAAVEVAKERTLALVDPGPLSDAERARIRSASEDGAVSAFRYGVGISAALVALGGALGLAGIRNPRREVPCEDCPGGALAGAPLELARERVATG